MPEMPVYKDPSYPIEERLDDLIPRMTLREKIMQTDEYSAAMAAAQGEDGTLRPDREKLKRILGGMSCGSIGSHGFPASYVNELQRYAVEETRLGIPFLFHSEALHGVTNGRFTAYPQQIGLAATFDPSLGYKMGRGIAEEARAVNIREVLCPVMDLARDPRYGRTEETYGEDTFLGGEFARETVKGMQGNSLTDDDAIAAEPKHYVGYGNPVGGLNCAPSTMGRHDVFTDCMPVFEQAFKEAGAVDAMCSYNSIDSRPVASDHEILTDVLRGEFGMPGFVRTDMTAVSRLYDWHFTADSPEEAIRQGMEAGCDMQLSDFPHEVWQDGIEALVTSGRMDEAVLDQACRRVLRTKYLTGMFDNPYVDETLEPARVHSAKHVADAREIAEKSIVLLKNAPARPGEKPLLPLDPSKLKSVAVIGPAADSAYLGDYSVSRGRTGQISVLKGISDYLDGSGVRVVYEKGCNYLGEEIHPFDPGMLVGEDGRSWLNARYYNGPVPEGTPVVDTTERRICYNWIYAKPYAEVDQRCFSARWTGFIRMPRSFSGTLGVSSMDSMRVWVDGELVIDTWGGRQDARKVIPFTYEAGRMYQLKVEFTNDARGARVILGYSEGTEDMEAAAKAAAEADVAVVCVGDNDETSGENFDRMDLNLPGRQLDLVRAVCASGTPVVLVLQTGRPVSAVWEDAHVPAILEAWFPGEQGGAAVAATLFGDNLPSGRLPVTFPRSVGQVPCHYSRRPGGGRRYIEMDWNPLYPFGYGLSYTEFSYSGLSVDRLCIRPGESAVIRFTVANVGDRPGTAVPQLYLRDMVSTSVKPEKELAGFAKLDLEPGESREVEITVTPRSMRTLDPDYVWSVEPGEFMFFIGDNAENQILVGAFTVVRPDAGEDEINKAAEKAASRHEWERTLALKS